MLRCLPVLLCLGLAGVLWAGVPDKPAAARARPAVRPAAAAPAARQAKPPVRPANPRAKPAQAVPVVVRPAMPAADSGTDSVDLMAALSRLELRLAWNPILEQAIFSRGSDTLVFQSGQSWGLFNSVRRVAIPKEGWGLQNGRLTLAAYDSLSQVFPLAANGERRRTISTIFIDPGHGGKDPGTIGRFAIDGKPALVYEKDIALAVGLELRDLLRAHFPDKKIVMSRDSDVYLPLDERTSLANRYAEARDKNTLFLSLHVNASPNSKGKGFEVWYLPPEYRRQLIAEDDVQVTDKSVVPIINSIIEEEYTVESILLAKSILTGMESASGGLSVNRGMKPEVWYVVRSARMPSVLAELGFVSNPEEFALLRSPDYLNKLGQGIYNGMVSFIADYESVSAK
jgi:N-acetylmuramoyl-L-alanine amidase